VISMPSVIHDVIIPANTELLPGARIQSNVFDVDGTVNVSVNVSITNVKRQGTLDFTGSQAFSFLKLIHKGRRSNGLKSFVRMMLN